MTSLEERILKSMGSLNAPRGLIVELITPLTMESDIDGKGLGRLLERISPFVQALFIAGPRIGEGVHLTTPQRLDLLEKTIVITRGNVPIFIWVSQETEKETGETILALNNYLERRKYTGEVFWVDTPLYYHSNRGLISYYKDICSKTRRPFILYNDPEFIKRLDRSLKRDNIRTSILKQLVDIENISGLIFMGSLERSYNYQKACRKRTSFRIYDGDEAVFLDYPSMNGVVSAGANLTPAAWQKMTLSSLQLTSNEKKYPDHIGQIWKTGRCLHDLIDLYRRMPVAVIKETLFDMGVIETLFSTLPAREVKEPAAKVMKLVADLNHTFRATS